MFRPIGFLALATGLCVIWPTTGRANQPPQNTTGRNQAPQPTSSPSPQMRPQPTPSPSPQMRPPSQMRQPYVGPHTSQFGRPWASRPLPPMRQPSVGPQNVPDLRQPHRQSMLPQRMALRSQNVPDLRQPHLQSRLPQPRGQARRSQFYPHLGQFPDKRPKLNKDIEELIKLLTK
jgi:hypothetical protein